MSIIQTEISYQWGMRYDAFISEAWPLIEAHWNEVGSHRDILSLDPDHERYRKLEQIGALHILTARHGKRLVGYFFVLTVQHPRDRGALAGHDDVIYVTPEYRPRFVGARLIEHALERLDNLGCNIVFFREKAWRHGGGYLKRYGFSPHETVWAKVLRRKGVA